MAVRLSPNLWSDTDFGPALFSYLSKCCLVPELPNNTGIWMESTDYYTKQLIGNMCIYTTHWLQPNVIPSASVNTSDTTEVHVEGQSAVEVSSLLIRRPISKNPLTTVVNTCSSQKSLAETSMSNCKDLESYYLYQFTEAERVMKPTEFWISKRSAWPILSETAIHILSVEATSCESERIFSFLGNLCQEKRSRLSSNKVHMLTLISRNLKTLQPLPDLPTAKLI